MKNYVIVSHDHGSNRCHYFTGADGSWNFGMVTEAVRFEYDEVLRYLMDNPNLGYLGVSITRIEDVTFERLEKAYGEIMDRSIDVKDRQYEDLWYNFHTWTYAAR